MTIKNRNKLLLNTNVENSISVVQNTVSKPYNKSLKMISNQLLPVYSEVKIIF